MKTTHLLTVNENIDHEKIAKDGKVYYKPELDALRFFAFVMVFFHHILPRALNTYAGKISLLMGRILVAVANGMGFGLGLFFLLSSFIITSILLHEKSSTGKIHIFSFYTRRTLRIWPLYFLALIIASGWALNGSHPEDWLMLKFYATFVGNWFFQGHAWTDNPMDPLWSLSIEEQFYLFFPLIFLIAPSRPNIGLGLTIFFISVAYLWYEGNEHFIVDTAIWTNSLSQAIFFGCGIILGTLSFKSKLRLNHNFRFVLVAAGLFCIFGSTFFTAAKQIEVLQATSGFDVAMGYIGPAIGCSALLLAFLDIPTRMPAVLVYLGKISFGLYVYHLICIDFTTYLAKRILHQQDVAHSAVATGFKLMSLPLTIAIAAISYHYYELPFLKLRQKFTYIKNRPD